MSLAERYSLGVGPEPHTYLHAAPRGDFPAPPRPSMRLVPEPAAVEWGEDTRCSLCECPLPAGATVYPGGLCTDCAEVA